MLTEEFTRALKDWALSDPAMEALLVVGSHARGAARADSDLDLVVITTRKAEMLADQSFTALFGEVERQQTEEYGACTSVRAWYRDGKEIEFGLVEPSWISLPLDPGTEGVRRDGHLVLVDKRGAFASLPL